MLIIEGDCLEAMRDIPGKSIQLILCDLPYGTTRNQWDSAIPFGPLWEQYRRIIRDDGAIALTSQGIFTARLILSMEAWFRYKLVWVKSKATNFLNARRQPLRKHEDVCVFYPKSPKYRPQMAPGEPYDKGTRKRQGTGCYNGFEPSRVRSGGQRYPTDVLYFPTAESEGPVWHPAQKPVALGRHLVRTYTDPGDMVLDNAFGSGSFLLAAALEGRDFIGIERNEQTFRFKERRIDCIDVAAKRLLAAGFKPEIRRR